MTAEAKIVASDDGEEELDTDKGEFFREIEQISHGASEAESTRVAIYLVRCSIKQAAISGNNQVIIYKLQNFNVGEMNVSLAFGDAVIEHFENEGFEIDKGENETYTTISW